MPPRPHFSPALFTFLAELRLHNDRGWFERNRERYLRDVRDPMLRFVADLAPALRAVAAPAMRRLEWWGESLKRAPRGFPADHPLDTLLRRKDLAAGAELTERDALSPRFHARVVEVYRTLVPTMRLLAGALDPTSAAAPPDTGVPACPASAAAFLPRRAPVVHPKRPRDIARAPRRERLGSGAGRRMP
jgi:uncharacterized protein (DUF2461 family)